MAAPIPSPFLLASHFLCLLAFIASCQTPPVSCRSLTGGGRGDPISDGVGSGFFPPPVLRLPRGSFPAAGYAAGCEATYGFLPCTTTALGNLFLIIVYGYLMFLAATFLSNGCELLLQILGPGIIGGLFLPVLGALPDAMLILVSGISGNKETAQSQVSVGMGLLAGSTVMLLTVVWGTCVIVGKCDIQDSIAKDSRDTVGLSLTGSGITTDIWTSHAAKIMVISVVPFIIVQAPQLLHSSSGRHLGVLIALVVSVTMLIAYCVFQVFQPWIQKRHIAFVKQKRLMAGFLSHLKKNALGRLLTDDGQPNISVIEKLFDRIDGDSDQRLSRPELLAFMVGVRFEEIDLNEDDAVENVMKDFDTSSNDYIEKEEFRDGIVRWIRVAQGHGASHGDAGPHTMRLIDDFHEETKREHDLMVDPTDTAEERTDNPGRISFKAISLLLLGTAIAAVFADPLVDAVDNFSTATSIPSFFISFIALPFATNSSEAVSAVIFASRKTRRTASLTFSELYGAATLNNVLCLSVFLALVYVRGLTWDFSAEVLIILIVCAAMGGFGSFCTTFRLHAAVLAICLYPLSIALVYVLDYVCGWS